MTRASYRVKAGRGMLLAVQAVRCEPVSADIPCLSRKMQVKSAIQAQVKAMSTPQGAEFPRSFDQIPYVVEQGICRANSETTVWNREVPDDPVAVETIEAGSNRRHAIAGTYP